MKKIAYLMVMALAVLTFSCKKETEQQKAEKELIEATSKLTSAEDINTSTRLIDCTYADKELTFRYEVPSDVLLRTQLDSLKATTLENLSAPSKKKLLKVVDKANARMRYVYKNADDSVSFTISSREITQLLDK